MKIYSKNAKWSIIKIQHKFLISFEKNVLKNSTSACFIQKINWIDLLAILNYKYFYHFENLLIAGINSKKYLKIFIPINKTCRIISWIPRALLLKNIIIKFKIGSKRILRQLPEQHNYHQNPIVNFNASPNWNLKLKTIIFHCSIYMFFLTFSSL